MLTIRNLAVAAVFILSVGSYSRASEKTYRFLIEDLQVAVSALSSSERNNVFELDLSRGVATCYTFGSNDNRNYDLCILNNRSFQLNRKQMIQIINEVSSRYPEVKGRVDLGTPYRPGPFVEFTALRTITTAEVELLYLP